MKKHIQSKLIRDEVLKRLSYNPETGELLWIAESRFGCNRKKGQVAGSDKGNGYRQISIMGEKHNAHRLIWFMHYGTWPVNDIDHINGDRADNRIANLRDVPRMTNLHNMQKKRANSSCSLLGVTKKGDKYFAQIVSDYKWHGLGWWATEIEAHEAYLAAKERLHDKAAA